MKFKFLYLLLLTLTIASPKISRCQDSTTTDSLDIRTNDRLVKYLIELKTRMHTYKANITRWSSDTLKKQYLDDAVINYGKVVAAQNGLIKGYLTLINTTKPSKIRMDTLSADVRALQKEYNSFVTFYKTHQDKTPKFAITTALIDLIFDGVKKLDEFIGGKIEQKRKAIKDSLDPDCILEEWDGSSPSSENQRPAATAPKVDTSKNKPSNAPRN